MAFLKTKKQVGKMKVTEPVNIQNLIGSQGIITLAFGKWELEISDYSRFWKTYWNNLNDMSLEEIYIK